MIYILENWKYPIFLCALDGQGSGQGACRNDKSFVFYLPAGCLNCLLLRVYRLNCFYGNFHPFFFEHSIGNEVLCRTPQCSENIRNTAWDWHLFFFADEKCFLCRVVASGCDRSCGSSGASADNQDVCFAHFFS